MNKNKNDSVQQKTMFIVNEQVNKMNKKLSELPTGTEFAVRDGGTIFVKGECLFYDNSFKSWVYKCTSGNFTQKIFGITPVITI
jgi:hypothetical protein